MLNFVSEEDIFADPVFFICPKIFFKCCSKTCLEINKVDRLLPKTNKG